MYSVPLVPGFCSCNGRSKISSLQFETFGLILRSICIQHSHFVFTIILFPSFHEQLGAKGIAEAVASYPSDIAGLRKKIDALNKTGFTSQEAVLEILFNKESTFDIKNEGKAILQTMKSDSFNIKSALEKRISVSEGAAFAHEVIKTVNIAKQKFDAKYDPARGLTAIPL